MIEEGTQQIRDPSCTGLRAVLFISILDHNGVLIAEFISYKFTVGKTKPVNDKKYICIYILYIDIIINPTVSDYKSMSLHIINEEYDWS
jgi:hypothetical protein